MRLIFWDLVQAITLQSGITLVLITSLLPDTVRGQAKYKRCDSISAEGSPTPGQCLEFPLCPRLLEFAKNPEKTLDDFRLLRQLTCGFHKDKPRVCCPDEDIYHPPPPDNKYYPSLPLEFPMSRADNLSAESSVTGEGRSSYSSETDHESEDSPYTRQDLDKLIPKLEDCGEPRFDSVTSTRIIGGIKAEPGQFPYMALLYRIDTETDEEEYYCAGTILNQFYILTAAHCILTNENTTTQLAFILVGITDVSQRCHKNKQRECLYERRYEVKETVVHPKYVYGSRDRSNDIALIRTAQPIELNEEFIRPVCLPIPKIYGIPAESLQGNKEDKRSSVSGAGVVAGWGRESNVGAQSSTRLNSVILPILSRLECQRRYAGQVKISEKQICAGGEIHRDTCVGDSGGPLLTPLFPDARDGQRQFYGKMFQTGIISYGPALCAISGKPSVYTKVFSYVDWILEAMHL